jgi:hypothetical protein
VPHFLFGFHFIKALFAPVHFMLTLGQLDIGVGTYIGAIHGGTARFAVLHQYGGIINVVFVVVNLQTLLVRC